MSSSKSKLNNEKLGAANLNGVLAPTKAAGGKSSVSAVVTGKAKHHSVNIVAKNVQGTKQNHWHHATRMDKPDSSAAKSAKSKSGDGAPAKKQTAPSVEVIIPSAATAYACSIAGAPGSSVSFSNTPLGPSPSLPAYLGTAKLALTDTGNALVHGMKSSITFNNVPLQTASWQPQHATAAACDAWSVTAALTKPRSVKPDKLLKPLALPAWLGQWAPKQLVSYNDSLVFAANNKSVRATASAVRGPVTISHAPVGTSPSQMLSARFAKTHLNALGGVSALATAPVAAKGDKSAQPSALRHLLTDHSHVLAPKVIATGTVNSKTELSVGMRRQCKRFMAALGLSAPLSASGKDASRSKRTIEASAKGTVPLLSAAPGGKGTSARPEQVAAADLSLYCGALYPLMLAAKSSCSVLLPPPPANRRHTLQHGACMKASFSPLQSVQHAIASSKLRAADVKHSWTLAAAVDLGAAGSVGWAMDSKQAGPSVGWKMSRSLLPTTQSSGATSSTSASQDTKRTTAEAKCCAEFRDACSAPSKHRHSGTALEQKSCHSFPGRVGTHKTSVSGAAASANVTVALAAALQPWRQLQRGALADCVRNFSASVALSIKHSPLHSVQKAGSLSEMPL